MKKKFIKFLKRNKCYNEYVAKLISQWKDTKYADLDKYLDTVEPETYISGAFHWDGIWSNLDEQWLKEIKYENS